jgi:predicted ferric reductase
MTTRMLPWILGRGLGIAAYLSLASLTALGLWLRHPWRARWRRPSPDAQLHAHAVLSLLTLLLLAGHIVALVLDRYAGVGLRGAVVPGAASFRPTAVALGTLSIYVGVIVGVTAAFAGYVGRWWRPIHALASLVFVLAFAHGVLAGSDTHQLRWLYVATGAVVVVLSLTRRIARPVATAVVPGANA